jgi:hypothetical protein
MNLLLFIPKRSIEKPGPAEEDPSKMAETENVEIAEYETGFASDKTLFISNNGVISGSSIVDVKISTIGGATLRKSLSVGDSLKYDAGNKGTFEIILLSIKNNAAKFLISKIG